MFLLVQLPAHLLLHQVHHLAQAVSWAAWVLVANVLIQQALHVRTVQTALFYVRQHIHLQDVLVVIFQVVVINS